MIEHERFHLSDKVYDNNREQRAFDHQKKLLEQWKPKMQNPGVFLKLVQDELDKLKTEGN